MNDLLIIGGGISGIYAALKLGGIVLEKNARLGGRIQFDTWRGHHVRMGGGLFRTSDNLIQTLLNEYHVPYHFKYDPLFYTQDHVDVLDVLMFLRRKWVEQPPQKETRFSEFALYHLGKEKYQTFLNTTLYNDYENDSTESVLDDPVEFTFMTSGNYGYANLQQLIERMSERISYQTHTEIVRLIDYNTHWVVQALVHGIPTVYTCRRIILATTVNAVERIFPHPYIRFIHPSPTMRIYGEFRKQDIPLLQRVIKGHTLLSFPLHQIIPIDAPNGVYMIAYSDEEYAKQLIPLQDDTETNRSELCRMIESSLHLSEHSFELVSIHPKYWEEAVHYIDRHVSLEERETLLYTLQHPHPMLRIVGEMVSEDNGWVEAALKSVNEIDWLKKPDNEEEEAEAEAEAEEEAEA
jgi:hypothetical protein